MAGSLLRPSRSHTQRQLQEKTNTTAEISTHLGLNMHRGKSKILKANTATTAPITLEGEALEVVENFTYLGISLTSKAEQTLISESELARQGQPFNS